jgi:predicted AlkP superfamily phosphohydrolase/phosphomutase
VIPERARQWLSRRLPGRRQEALLADLFAQGTDWARTTAFSLPSLYTGFIRVNLRGREPAGIVAPEDYVRVLDDLEADLRALEDAETGEPAVDSVIRTVDAFGGGPPERLPDLFVEWRPGTRLLEAVRHPRGELRQRRPRFCPGSEETLVGLVAAAGPGVGGRGRIGDLVPDDFAPTLLHLLGRSQPADMPGRPHRDLIGDYAP